MTEQAKSQFKFVIAAAVVLSTLLALDMGHRSYVYSSLNRSLEEKFADYSKRQGKWVKDEGPARLKKVEEQLAEIKTALQGEESDN